MTDAGVHHRRLLSVWLEMVRVAEGHDGTVDASQVTKVMIDACMNYLTRGLGLAIDDVITPTARPIIAETRVRCVAVMRVGEEHCVTVGATGRSTRSFTLTIEIEKVGGANVAVGEIRFVTIDPSIGRSIEIPQGLWAAVERVEGRSIPVEPR
jgi:acyl-CoA thioesterase FadM